MAWTPICPKCGTVAVKRSNKKCDTAYVYVCQRKSCGYRGTKMHFESHEGRGVTDTGNRKWPWPSEF